MILGMTHADFALFIGSMACLFVGLHMLIDHGIFGGRR